MCGRHHFPNMNEQYFVQRPDVASRLFSLVFVQIREKMACDVNAQRQRQSHTPHHNTAFGFEGTKALNTTHGLRPYLHTFRRNHFRIMAFVFPPTMPGYKLSLEATAGCVRFSLSKLNGLKIGKRFLPFSIITSPQKHQSKTINPAQTTRP